MFVGVWVCGLRGVVWWCVVFIRCLMRLIPLWFGVLVGLCCGGLRTQERVLYYFLCFDNASNS